VKRWLPPRRLRSRLTLWYVMVLGAVLSIYISGATLLFFWHLSTQMYQHELQDLDSTEELLYLLPSGLVSVHDEYHPPVGYRFPIERFVEVRSADGKILYQDDSPRHRELGGPPSSLELEPGFHQRSLELSDGTRVLMVSRVHSIGSRQMVLRIAYGMSSVEHRVIELVAILLAALPLALTAAAYGGYRVVGRALVPLQKMALRAQEITASRLNERLPIENAEDELGSLAKVFNQLLERLQESFEQLRRFTSDVSHELRTPLSAIRCVGEAGLRQAKTLRDFQEIVGSMLEEVNRLTQMTDTLLTISRVDAGQLQMQFSEFSIADLIHEAVSLIGVLAEEKNQTLDVTILEDMAVRADRMFLHQAIVNLLHNAVKYSPQGGSVHISVSRKSSTSIRGKDDALLEFIDSGPGIPEEDRLKIFNRFHRVDKNRSSASGGVGLGLAITKWAVEANGGKVGLAEGTAAGSRFFIEIPIV
jgi:heavy metal sensor kinase